jgi:hypothetical protein
MAQGTRVSGNLCYNNDYVDFFPEVDHGPYLVDNNLLLSGFSIKDWSEGGAYVHNLIAGMVSRAHRQGPRLILSRIQHNTQEVSVSRGATTDGIIISFVVLVASPRSRKTGTWPMMQLTRVQAMG